jgi:hypothetical protein
MRLQRVFKISWLLLAIIILVVVLAAYDGRPNSDIEQFLIGAMMVLSFPIGFVVAGLFSGMYALLASCCEIAAKTSYTMLFVEWLGFFAAGYLQWFVLLPWVIRKWRSRRVAPAH